MEVHIFTGAKGGVGKTMFALATINHFRDNYPCVVIDSNTTNADLSRILAGNAPKRIPNPDNDTNLELFFWQFQERITLIKPVDSFDVTSSLGFWKRLDFVTKSQLPERSEGKIIIDTGYHPANLYSERKRRDISPILANLRSHGCQKIHIWYIWTPSAMHPNYPDAVDRMDEALIELRQSDGPEFSIVHVLNLHALRPAVANVLTTMRILVDTALGRETTQTEVAEGLSRMATADLGDPIELEAIVNKFQSVIEGLPQPKEQFLPADIYEEVAKALIKLSEMKYGEIRRFRNVFPIPIYSQTAISYVDKLIVSDKVFKFEDAMEPIEEIGSFLSNYLPYL